MTAWDVLVVGAGPAGSTAARVAAEHGARVLLVDAARFPRYKTCGGGLVGASLAALPPGVAGTAVERRVDRAAISFHAGRARRIRSSRPFLAMVDREPFDQALVDAAVAAGAEFRDGVRVRALVERDGGVEVRTDGEPLAARIVVGADGASGVTGRFVGVRIARTDLGLEFELAVPDDLAPEVALDWGRAPGSYGWSFPKAGRATVGVIERRGSGAATRAYLDAYRARLGLADAAELRFSGHLTRWREPDSPLVRGRVLVAGEAAGLLEPWTREGISFALRSGALAGAAAADAAAGDPRGPLAAYERDVARTLVPEQRAGAALLRIFERFPGPVHLLYTRTGAGARAFVRFCRGDLSLARVLAHPVAGRAVRLLAGRDPSSAALSR